MLCPLRRVRAPVRQDQRNEPVKTEPTTVTVTLGGKPVPLTDVVTPAPHPLLPEGTF
jgi:hypothetical protein